jgi:hypothetical protein
MRMFAAVVPPEDVLEGLEEFLAPRREAAPFRWAPPEQWHLTLAFMAKVPDRSVEDLLERMARAGARRTPFALRLAGGGAFPAVVQRELDRYLPFLATTKVLMAAVRAGVGREAAHEAIKTAAVGVALDMRRGQAENDVLARLAADPALGLSTEQLEALVAEPISFTGAAVDQVRAVVRRVERLVEESPEEAAYRPGAIL